MCICRPARRRRFHRAPGAKLLQSIPLGQRGLFRVIDHEAAAFAGHDVLVDLKAEGDHIAECTDAPPFPSRAYRLCRIFDDAQRMLGREPIKPVHVARQAAHMDRDDRPRPRSDGRRNLVDIDIVAAGSMSANTGVAPLR